MKTLIKTFRPILLSGAFLLSCASGASANLLTNGSFESGGFVPDGNNTMTLSPGSTAMTGWTVTNSDLAWIKTPNTFGLSAIDGAFFLDLTGYDDSAPHGGVTQSIATVLGGSYALTFDLGGSTRYGVPNSLTACAGATCSPFAITATGTNDWVVETLNFTGTGGAMAISLTGLSGGNYIGLDKVSVDGPVAVPEPITLSLFGAGFAGAVAMRRRKKAKKS